VAKRYLVLISRICAALVGVIAVIAFANVCAYVYLKPALPDVGSLRDVQLQVPLRVYTRDGRLIAAIGDQRRIPVRYEQLPKKLVQAFLATEDDRFFQHHGVDWQGILRAAVANFKAGRISQGASTITMQVSRDMFLTPHRDMKRKMSEVYISLLMESEFTKEEIFSLYVNKIFLGQRAYGVAAAAEVYFGKTLDQLTIAEMATLAGIPTAPSVVNPVASAEASRVRRTHVLGRMRELGYITEAEYQTANTSPVESRLHGPTIEVDAPYVAEMVRNDMQAKYGDSIYTAGFRVYTTIDSRLEGSATVALRTGLLQYDRRHGWRGATAKVDLAKAATPAGFEQQLEEFPIIGGLRPAVVQSVEAKSAKVFVRGLGSVTLPWEKLSWARRELPEEQVDRSPTAATDIFNPGDVIYTVGTTAENLEFVQVPEVQSALVSVDPKDGAVVALVGGFDFFQSKFNRATQARRQPGSGFKPFVYAAAFDKGYTPASVVLDAPIVVDEAGMEQAWRPKEDENQFVGPVRLREALAHSRNLVSVRIVRDIGVDYVRNYVHSLRLREGPGARRPDHGLGHGLIESAAGGGGLFHLRERWLQGHALLHRQDRGRRRQGAGTSRSRHRLYRVRAHYRAPARINEGRGECPRRLGRGRGARWQNHTAAQEFGAPDHSTAGRLSARGHDAGRHSARHRRQGARAEPRRYCRQDRHDQRCP
jgi:penicillin-binding protein 1A